MTIFEMMMYGPVMACDEERGLLVTVNGFYFNLWAQESPTHWTNTHCRPLNNGMDGLHGLKITEVMDRAREYLEAMIREEEEGMQ